MERINKFKMYTKSNISDRNKNIDSKISKFLSKRIKDVKLTLKEN